MSPILQILQEFSHTTAVEPSYTEKLQNLIVLQEKIQHQFGLSFLDEFSAAWNDLHMAELDRAYEQGFLTAFRLWAEVSAMERGL